MQAIRYKQSHIFSYNCIITAFQMGHTLQSIWCKLKIKYFFLYYREDTKFCFYSISNPVKKKGALLPPCGRNKNEHAGNKCQGRPQWQEGNHVWFQFTLDAALFSWNHFLLCNKSIAEHLKKKKREMTAMQSIPNPSHSSLVLGIFMTHISSGVNNSVLLTYNRSGLTSGSLQMFAITGRE